MSKLVKNTKEIVLTFCCKDFYDAIKSSTISLPSLTAIVMKFWIDVDGDDKEVSYCPFCGTKIELQKLEKT